MMVSNVLLPLAMTVTHYDSGLQVSAESPSSLRAMVASHAAHIHKNTN